MKKIIFLLGLYCLGYEASAQANLWWKLDGSNAVGANSAIGTSNNEPLRFISFGTEWFRISPTGTYSLFSLTDPTTNGLMVVRSNGDLARVNYSGSVNDVFRGDGTFGSIGSMTGWTLGTNLTTGYNVGIGTSVTPEKLTVDGNILANGSISGTSLNVIDIVTTGREYKISNSLCIKGIDAGDPLSRNEICGMNGDLYIQSENANYNTIINKGNGGKVGIGVIPDEAFHVGVNAKFDSKVTLNRISVTDTVFALGDSTLYFSTYYNNMWGSTTTSNKGTGLGQNTFGVGLNSIAIGKRVRADGSYAIAIGKTDASSPILNNTTDNSLMVAFNSNLPTFYVGPASGTNTYGKVGISTSNPGDR